MKNYLIPAFALALLLCGSYQFLSSPASAAGISQLDQFTSTTTPASAITQNTFGKALRLTGQGTGCATFSSNGTLTSTGVACGTGSSGGSYPFPAAGNATGTLTQFNAGLTSLASTTIGGGNAGSGLTINGTGTSTQNFRVGIGTANLATIGQGFMGVNGVVLNSGAQSAVLAAMGYSTARSFNIDDTGYLSWSNNNDITVGTDDTFFSRASAGVLRVGTASNNALGSLNAANVTVTSVLTTPQITSSGNIQISAGTQNYVFGSTASGQGLGFPGTNYIAWNGGATRISAISNGVVSFGTAAATNAASLLANALGLATSTPFARLSGPTQRPLAAGVPAFSVGSSTRQDFIVNQAGNVGIGTASPLANLQVGAGSLPAGLASGVTAFINGPGVLSTSQTLAVNSTSGPNVVIFSASQTNTDTTQPYNASDLLIQNNSNTVGNTGSVFLPYRQRQPSKCALLAQFFKITRLMLPKATSLFGLRQVRPRLI